MIIVSIFGGLGNQMFQYACGRAIAKRLDVELKLDISLLTDRTKHDGFTFRDYELRHFKIGEKIADIKEVRKYVPNLWQSTDFEKKSFKIKRVLTNKHLYYEKKKYQFEERILSIKDNTLLFGYFQSELYFKSLREELTTCYQLNKPLDNLNQLILNEISENDSVSIHIRRGDYINLTFEKLGIVNYYTKAIERIGKQVTNPVFYFFSDDISWVKENFSHLSIPMKFIEHNSGNKSFIDMYLMSKCKHNICANSTFSWWAAWLNSNTEKIVIVPQKWYSEGPFKDKTYDLLPEEWVKL